MGFGTQISLNYFHCLWQNNIKGKHITDEAYFSCPLQCSVNQKGAILNPQSCSHYYEQLCQKTLLTEENNTSSWTTELVNSSSQNNIKHSSNSSN